ncbi:unnamed protein product [Periconia digitata]|uniref:Rho-GAP domain-containing protein n=1 Tax=Periconia digitata TaxID=1303443 RepID=A0A9W4XU89_9PLEO|nr:unnamed protein product [Periconia digitata]
MPHGAHNHGPLSTPRARNGEPTPAAEPASAKRDLTSWWKQFSKRNMKKEEEKEPEQPRGIFGVPLITSIPYANVAISLFKESGESYIYGYVPIVVAKCGVFLKEKATDVEGIFRLAGSEKRIKELKAQFDTPPRWGKGLDWSGYTVHDAANILRRYFNQLPEPIIPLQYYDRFRAPLRGHQAEAVGPIEGQSPSVGGFDPDEAVHVYQQLIKDLPSLNRQLLLYILDLLAVFAAKAESNKMTTSNLAAIFQPGILSHPQHDMSPQDYRLSQDVLIFLIDNQDHFLIGMEGTEVDEGTARHVESGPSTPQARTPTTPVRNQSSLGRSASAASSAAAESVRRFGDIRRNVSTSSRRSRHSGVVPSPTTPSYATTGSGVHRSNTVPSKRSPALPASHFAREKASDPPTPSAEDKGAQLPAAVTTTPAKIAEAPETSQQTTAPSKVSASSTQRPQTPPAERSEAAKLQPPAHIELPKPNIATPGLEMPGAFIPSPAVAPPASEFLNSAPSAQAGQALVPPTEHQPRRSPQTTPKHERSEFMEGPIDTGTPVEPTPAVRTFTQILNKVSPDEKSSGRKPNKLQKRRVPSANPSAQSSTHSLSGPYPTSHEAPPSPLPQSSIPHSHPVSSKEQHHAYNSDTVSSRNSGTTLKPSMSPSASFRSHSTATEYSEPEDFPREEKKSFWKSHKRAESKATPTASQTDLHGSIPNADKSMSSIGSSSGMGGGRRSLQYDSHQSSDLSVAYGDAKDHNERKNPFDWFNKKRQEHKERADKRQRAKSPPGSTSDLSQPHGLTRPRDDLAVRGRSIEVPRPTESQDSSDVTPTAVTPNPLKTTPSPPMQATQDTVPPPAAAPTESSGEKQAAAAEPSRTEPSRTEPAATLPSTQEPTVKTDDAQTVVPADVSTAKPVEAPAPATPVKSLLDIGLEASKAKDETKDEAKASNPANSST